MRRGAMLVALILSPLFCSAAQIGGVTVPDTARVGGDELLLNGGGLRRMSIVDVYVAALYLPSRLGTAAEVLVAPGAKRVRLVMLRDITAQQLSDALAEGIRDTHAPREAERLRPRMEALARVMHEIGVARKGSAITLDYLPGIGTQGGLDGASVGSPIPGEDFYRAVLRIWLGDPPVDERLRKALLGRS